MSKLEHIIARICHFNIRLFEIKQNLCKNSEFQLEQKELLDCFKKKVIKKRQMIVQPDFVATSRNYVLKGTFRAYVIGDEGQDHTIQFAIEDWWITDYNSYVYQRPATMFVVALEDSIILQIDFETEKKLKAKKHIYETFFRMHAEGSTAYMQRRIISNLTKSAKERYEGFIENYPKIAQKVPQYALASFLGMTTEYLSRLRHDIVSRKS